jgi:hypothetical protein
VYVSSLELPALGFLFRKFNEGCKKIINHTEIPETERNFKKFYLKYYIKLFSGEG